MLSGWNAMTPTSLWQGNLCRVAVQLLGQLCNLGLKVGVLWEEQVAFLKEREDDTLKEEEED